MPDPVPAPALPSPEPADFAGLSLAALVRLVADRKPAPVDDWHPRSCGDSAMRIARDGTWYHEGAPIRRPAMVRLFANILRREPDGNYVLVTPVEKLDIAVEDAPFVAVAVNAHGTGRDAVLAFRLNTGDVVIADADHPLRLVDRAEGARPYLTVRRGLDALIARPVYYELAAFAIADDAGDPALWSAGCCFALTPASADPAAGA